MSKVSSSEAKYINEGRVLRLSTIKPNGNPHVSPFVYVLDGDKIYISEAYKMSAKNISKNPQVSFIVDTYLEDWAKLQACIGTGKAKILKDGEEYEKAADLINEKYPQHKAFGKPELVIVIKIDKTKSWGLE